MFLDKKIVFENIRIFAETFRLNGTKAKHEFKYGTIQKKMMIDLLKYRLDGGHFLEDTNAMCGNLTNHDIDMFALYKQDPNHVDKKEFGKAVQKAITEYGQISNSLYRGLGHRQYKGICNMIDTGKTKMQLLDVQSFSNDYDTAYNFAKHGSGSIVDKDHGKGAVIVIAKTSCPFFFIDEFEFYSIMSEELCYDIFKSSNVAQFAETVNCDEIFDLIAYEGEWLVPTNATFKLFERGFVDSDELVFTVS